METKASDLDNNFTSILKLDLIGSTKDGLHWGNHEEVRIEHHLREDTHTIYLLFHGQLPQDVYGQDLKSTLATMVSNERRKSVLITGCSEGGIGAALAHEFHARGFRVFATARSISKLQSFVQKGIETLPLAVDSEESVQACLASVEQLTGDAGLDFIVHNAGITYPMPALDVNIDEAKQCFNTNFWAVMRLTQVFAPLLIRANGTIVMIDSLSAVMPFVFSSVYNASKAALLAYANTLRVELAPFGVKVISIMAGGVKSNLTEHNKPTLPENSLYNPIKQHFQRRVGASQEGAMTNEAFAASVVAQVLPGAGSWPWKWFLKDARRQWIWEGSYSWIMYYLSGGWAWNPLLDILFAHRFGLTDLPHIHVHKD